jgi:hypothetical protein
MAGIPPPPNPQTYLAGYFTGEIVKDNDGNPDFASSNIEFHFGKTGQRNIELIASKLATSDGPVNIGKGVAKEDNGNIVNQQITGGKSIKKRVRKNRKTKKTRRNRK